MPVRKIPRNYRGVTGVSPSRKSKDDAEFESLLEGEYLLILDWDPEVKSFDVQPVTIPVPGRRNPYRPDVLVHFVDGATGQSAKPLLVEVKPEQILKRDEAIFTPAFDAAKRLCRSNGWRFAVKTEKDIRTPHLAALRQLRDYRRREPPPATEANLVLKAVAKLKTRATFAGVLEHLSDPDDQETILRWSPVLLTMIAHRQLIVKLDAPVQPDTRLSLPKVSP